MPASNATRMDPARERALVERARVDPAAFGELYDWYLPRIFAFVARRVADRASAEDVTAMTFERALGAVRRADFRNDAFGGFLYRVAANAAVDHARRGRWTVPLGVRAGDRAWSDGSEADADGRVGAVAEPDDDAATRALTAALDRDALRRALVRLPDGQRRVIVLKYLDGLETDELCAALGCSRATFAVRLHRALRALRAALREEASDVA
jgi:RNA polymerase sigma-70 factor (ECF subfamily)